MAIDTPPPLVSIIIPTYNHARFIVQAVEAALAQTYPALEIIVVDDGSTDETAALLEPYQGQITVLHQSNSGVAAARNAGVQIAQGEYYLFLDADDWIPPHKLAKQMAVFQTNPELGVVYSAWQYIAEKDGHVLGEMRPQKAGDVLEDLLLRRFHCVPGAAIVRRVPLEQVGLFDPDCPAAADTDLWVRLAYAGYHFGYVNEPLLHYRQVSGSMSNQYDSQARDEFTRLDKFFARPDLPERVRALQDEAYAILFYELAVRHYHLGDTAKGQTYLRQAIHRCPLLAQNEDWLVDWLAGYALGPTVTDAPGLYKQILAHLPLEAVTLAGLRRRLIGHYHIAAAFQAYHNQQYQRIRPHILPALLWYPRVLFNRGFLRIIYQAMNPH